VFSAYFLWGVFTQFSQHASAYRALFLFWAVFMIVNLRQLSEHLAEILTSRGPTVLPLMGTLRSFSSPRTVECEMPASAPTLQAGSKASIRVPSGRIVAHGQVVDDRILDGIRIVRFGVTNFQDGWGEIADGTHSGLQGASKLNHSTRKASPLPPPGSSSQGQQSAACASS
jgi:hypothetical protein